MEDFLRNEIKKQGGMSFKLISIALLGMPENLILLPNGIIFFVKIQRNGEKMSKNQLKFCEKITRLGFNIYICQSMQEVKDMIRYELNCY